MLMFQERLTIQRTVEASASEACFGLSSWKAFSPPDQYSRRTGLPKICLINPAHIHRVIHDHCTRINDGVSR